MAVDPRPRRPKPSRREARGFHGSRGTDKPPPPGRREHTQHTVRRAAQPRFRTARRRLSRLRFCTTRTRAATILRANPYPEVTDRFCRLPLPTFFYAARDLLISETCCGYRYEPARRLRVALSRIFKVRVGITDTAAASGALRARVPISRLADSRDVQRS